MRKLLWLYTKLIALLLIPILFIILYSKSNLSISTPLFALEKVTLSNVEDNFFSVPKSSISTQNNTADDPILVDSLLQDSCVNTTSSTEVITIDTTKQRVLLIGDSMVEGLQLRMSDYANENGYDLMAVIWYSSNTNWFSKSDTLRHFMKKHNPDFVMISLGGNEQFVRDLDKRANYVRNIVNKIGDIPFVWIGTPTWRGNTNFNDTVRNIVGDKRFFVSSRLKLKRCSDNAHPTLAAASDWMDSIAIWMSSPETAHPIRMNIPTEKRKRVHKTVMLQPHFP